MAVDGGALFGRRKDAWKEEYFIPTDWQRRTWAPRPDAMERLVERMRGLVFEATYGADEGLPGLETATEWVDLGDAGVAAYGAMCEDMVVDVSGGVVEAVNQAVRSGKLQQIASGFLYRDDGGVEWLGDEKISALRRVVRAHAGPVLICYQFVEELERLRATFPGGVELRDRPGVVETWNAGGIRLLFMHGKSGGHGLNLQGCGCSLVVFTGPLWSRDVTDQVIGRVRRRGAAVATVRVVTLCCRGTVDELVLARLAGKAAGRDAFLAHIKKPALGGLVSC